MPTAIKMPRLGESVAEGTVGAWLKQEGDYIERDESLAEIITDKINADLPSPVAGWLVKILVKTDETVPVGADIALIEESADVTSSQSAQPARGPDAAPVQSFTQAATPVMERSSVPTSNNGVATAQVATAVARVQQSEDEERQRISPLARRLAHEHGIDLNQIVGTGIGGRVRKEDIRAYVAQRQADTISPIPAPYISYSRNTQIPISTEVAPIVVKPPVVQPAAQPSLVQSKPVTQTVQASITPISISADEEVMQPSRMRLSIAEHMVRSKRTSPHATTVVEVDMTNIAKWLERNKDDFKRREGYGISFVPFVMKAVCEGIRKFPLINSTWTEDNKIIIKKRINLGIAVATDAGLVVPTIYDADQYTLAGLARQVSGLAQRARTNKLTIQDMQNSTFVVNNPGIFGTIISVPIINQPHAGILSMDAVVKRPIVIEDDAIAVRHMMYLCLSFDHRILDGAGAAGFLQAVRAKLQSYGREIDVY